MFIFVNKMRFFGCAFCDTIALYNTKKENLFMKQLLKEGEGILRLANGMKYRGGFLNGEEHGNGVAVDADGTRYEGTFEEGQRHGKFIIKDASGNIVRECVYSLGKISNK